MIQHLRRYQTAISVAVLALLAYVPSLTAAPGRMVSDSKLYVYLNPGRFIGDTTTTFDPRQYAGWVPHQHIAYLWPTGPWYWVFEQLGVPDWVAHRLWIGTLLFLAGLGVGWMTRLLGFPPLAALTAALVYQLSPYILPYLSRTSVLLLPFAGLGWIVGLTVLASLRGRWRDPAAIALVVLTVGAVNATALAMIVPGPVLWLVHAAWGGTITWRRAVTTAAKTAFFCAGVSLWWIVMLLIQGRHGADVLAYSESLESVSFTSTSTEVTRGLGYWLFYIRDAFGATTAASIHYLVSLRVILVGLALTMTCLAGIVFVRFEHRRFAALLVAAGVLIGVGVHPIDDRSPIMTALVNDSESGLALALRSSTRAVPVLLLGLGLGAAAAVSAIGDLLARMRIRVPAPAARTALAAVVGLMAVVNLPALRNGGFVDPGLERDQDPPAAWTAATAELDALAPGYRVLQVPGTEFGSYRWGHTVDQPLPALTERPLVTRDLLPLGSAAAMDLAFALDDRFQEGTLEPEAVVAVSRLLGVDTVWITGDVAYERYRLARPEFVTDELTSNEAVEAGLVRARAFGEPTSMRASPPVVDEDSVSDPRVGEPIAPVTLVDVAEPIPTVRIKDELVVVVGGGAGIVDAAAAGLLDGDELIVYAASVADPADLPARADHLLVTDSNRDRAHHWRGSQDVHGFTESAADESDLLRFESADQRLPVFDTSDGDTQTVSIQRGPVTARATAYGEPFAYLPEHRPAMAVDGDPNTAWLVADRFAAEGEYIELTVAEPVDHLDLLQPPATPEQRTITEVDVAVDGGSAVRVALDDRSREGAGQRVELDAAAGSVVRVTIVGTSRPVRPAGVGSRAVGFSEIGTGLEPTMEWIRVPLDAGRFADAATVDHVFTRLRTSPTDRWRDDPEPVLRREFDDPIGRVVEPFVTMRVDRRATDEVLSALLDEPVLATAHLTGDPSARGAAAFDGDPDTAWITPFDAPNLHSARVRSEGEANTIAISQPTGTYSTITSVRLTDSTGSIELSLIGLDDGEAQPLPRPVDLADVRLDIVEITEAITIDRRFGERVVLPSGIAEVTFDVGSPRVEAIPRLVADCRTDLLTLDGQPIALSFDVSTADALAGAPIEATICDDRIELAPGEHQLASTPATVTGLHVDRVVLRDTTRPPNGGDSVGGIDPTDTVLVDSGRRSRTVEAPPCPDGCWVVVGEGWNPAWSAQIAGADAGDLGEPLLVDGNANGWWIPPTSATTTVVVEWTAQTPLTIALVNSALSILAAIALIVWDRRRVHAERLPIQLPTVAGWGRVVADREVIVAGVATVVVAALFIDWIWAVPAAVVVGAGLAVRSTRLIGWVGWSILGGVCAVVLYVVRQERPRPDAGWPARFEWVHGWTLLAVILIAGSAVLAVRRKPQ